MRAGWGRPGCRARLLVVVPGMYVHALGADGSATVPGPGLPPCGVTHRPACGETHRTACLVRQQADQQVLAAWRSVGTQSGLLL